MISKGKQDATLAPSGVKIPVNVKMSASMGSSIIQSRSWYEDSGSNEPEQWVWKTFWKLFSNLPSHYVNQCWVIIDWALRKKLQWNFNQNSGKCIRKCRLRNGSHLDLGRGLGATLLQCSHCMYFNWSPSPSEVPPVIRNLSAWLPFSFVTDHIFLYNSLRPSDAYMLQKTNHHWFRRLLVAW